MTFSRNKLQRNIAFSIILAESTHVFCCVLPTLVTILSIMASLGTITQVPVFMLDIHEALHHFEVPIIVFSGVMLALGWVLYEVSRRIDCKRPHCEPHETECAPQKNNTHLVLMVASILFVINLTIYLGLHVGSADLIQAQVNAAH